ncbi:MATE family efflux transporter [Bulleidia sp. zg-1006]|uniref:MATE family efflux transporter n=1 Tax=Bulleidia sp. zg-1006 TaxID=2806552 RepID=UPI001EEF41D9|nr:MATE family efflux transporter [Bulleidia sp. zg-1006]
MRSHNMLKGSIWKEILIFFFPILLGYLFQQLYNTVDAMVVGNFVGTIALGAVGGSTSMIINLIIGFVVGLSTGATVIIAQFIGANEKDKVHLTVSTIMLMNIVLGIVLMVLGLIFSEDMLKLLSVPKEMMQDALIYLRIYLLGLIPTMIYNAGAGILRAVGDAKRPLYFLMVASITNIVLDIFLVIYVHLGVAGAAIATVVSQAVTCALTLYIFHDKDEVYYLDLKQMKFDYVLFKRIISIGLPTAIQGSLYSFANLFIQSSVNSYGTVSVASFTAFGKIDMFFWNFSGAMGASCLTFVGQNFGAKQFERVKKGIRIALGMFLLGSINITIVSILFGEQFYRLFTQDSEVVKVGMQILWLVGPFWNAVAFLEIYSASLRAMNVIFVPMIISLIGVVGVRILWILFYPGHSILDTLLVYPISWCLTASFFILFYISGIWKKGRI